MYLYVFDLTRFFKVTLLKPQQKTSPEVHRLDISCHTSYLELSTRVRLNRFYACFRRSYLYNGVEGKTVETPTNKVRDHLRPHSHRWEIVWSDKGGRGRRRWTIGVCLWEVQVTRRRLTVVGWKWRQPKPNTIEAWVWISAECFFSFMYDSLVN